jgi:hypothetical protein
VYGKAVVLAAKAANVKGAVIERRVGTLWQPASRPGVAPRATAKLLEPSTFRVTAGKLVGPVLKVPVAPVVTARASGGLTVTGTVRPLDPGATVELQVDSERGWFTTATTTTGPGGSFTLALPEPGRYRARVAPVQGFAEGLSGQFELS